MRLADFIVHDLDAIVAMWESFASTLVPAADGMESLALRDHAPEILQAVAKDLETYQSREAQTQKSLGQKPLSIGLPKLPRKRTPCCERRAASTSSNWLRSIALYAQACCVYGQMHIRTPQTSSIK